MFSERWGAIFDPREGSRDTVLKRWLSSKCLSLGRHEHPSRSPHSHGNPSMGGQYLWFQGWEGKDSKSPETRSPVSELQAWWDPISNHKTGSHWGRYQASGSSLDLLTHIYECSQVSHAGVHTIWRPQVHRQLSQRIGLRYTHLRLAACPCDWAECSRLERQEGKQMQAFPANRRVQWV